MVRSDERDKLICAELRYNYHKNPLLFLMLLFEDQLNFFLSILNSENNFKLIYEISIFLFELNFDLIFIFCFIKCDHFNQYSFSLSFLLNFIFNFIHNIYPISDVIFWSKSIVSPVNCNVSQPSIAIVVKEYHFFVLIKDSTHSLIWIHFIHYVQVIRICF